VYSLSQHYKAHSLGVTPTKETRHLVQNRLNLATKPFTNRALPWEIAIILLLFALIAMVFIARSTSEANAKAQVTQREIDGLKQQELDILKQQDEVKRSLTADQLKSLKSAHELVNRKRFSWSRLFADLEAVLPGEVRVSRIAVRQIRMEAGITVADLELSVVSKSYSTVTEMMATMEQQGIFHADLLNQNLQKGRDEGGGSEYELKVDYRPRFAYPAAPTQPARAALDPAQVAPEGGLK
jgi:Tfp pilus assembly protein PilN